MNKRTRSHSNCEDEEKSGESLEILPVRPLDTGKEPVYHPHLPSIKRNAGSVTLLLGSTAAGKTTCLVNMIASKHFWGGKNSAFDKIFVFSPSIRVDNTIRHLQSFCECYDDFKDQYLKDIQESQRMFPIKEMPKILIVIDDAVGLIARNSLLNKFISRHRHYNCSIIMSVQHMKSISPVGRNCATNILLFNGIVNHKEWDNINEEWGSQYKNSLEPCYYRFANKKYSFLHLDIRKNPAKLYQNFTKEIKWKKYIPKKTRERITEMMGTDGIEFNDNFN
tara:strand:+ start:11392 stop:12228 length:837 start_codon:yes stop_codon:yes gene_type:complete